MTGKNGDGPGVKLFDQLIERNLCRVAATLEEHPEFEQFKYASAAAASGCELIENYFPIALQKRAADYFESQGVTGSDGSISTTVDLMTDTVRRQSKMYLDKYGRQLWLLERSLGSRERAQAELDRSNTLLVIENKEASSYTVMPLRYVLEPYGIEVSRWSMSIDPTTYTFADQMKLSDQRFNQAIYKAYLEEEQNPAYAAGKTPLRYCDWLREKSLVAYGDLAQIERAEEGVPCPTRATVLEDRARQNIEDSRRDLLRVEANRIFAQYGCIACHMSGALGAPPLPFGDIEALEALFQKTAGTAMDVRSYIWSRVSRDPNAPKRMPLVGPSVSDEDKVLLKSYLDTFDTPNGSQNQ